MRITKIIHLFITSCLMLMTFDGYGGRGGGGRHRSGGRHRGGHSARHRGHRVGHRGGHRVARHGGRGYAGRGYRGYGRGYGLGGGWGWGANPFLGYPWWGLYWSAGLIGGYRYRYAIPQEAVTVVYKGDYPYWGYDLGADKQLDQLAQQDKWDEIKQQLTQLRAEYLEQLNEELDKSSEEQDANRIATLKDKLNKIQLHLHGLRQQAK